MPRKRDETTTKREYLRTIRHQFSLTQRQFAAKIDIPYRTYENYEKGIRHFVNERKIDFFDAVSDKFSVSIAVLEQAEEQYQDKIRELQRILKDRR